MQNASKKLILKLLDTIKVIMAHSVKLSNEIINQAKAMSIAMNRSITGQIEFWAKIGMIAEENPDLNFDFIKKILISNEEIKLGRISDYKFE